ncbi:MAG: ATP-binding protein [Xenophilus sp.]
MDGKRLQQVLLNLISNAAKFTRDGTVTLTVTARPGGELCTLHFTVSDTGIGIDLNQGVDIFGAFQQVQPVNGGVGLGLFIAQRILASMGGSLSVASACGQGTTFAFALPVPTLGAFDAAWSAVTPREATASGAPSAQPALLGCAMPADQALSELASLAGQGRFTDIESWVERHAGEAAHAPFIALLRELLERFDFPGIRALVLNGRSQSSQ